MEGSEEEEGNGEEKEEKDQKRDAEPDESLNTSSLKVSAKAFLCPH